MIYSIVLCSSARHFVVFFKSFGMSNQPRVVKVLASLLASMTIGAIVLMALGHNPPAAGPWSLSRSLRADSIQLTIDSEVVQSPGRWDRIEVCYSGTQSGNIEQLAQLSGLTSAKALNCHFVVCNGVGGNDGQVLPTEKWLRQWSITPGAGWRGTNTTIRICVVGDGLTKHCTNAQLRKVDALAKELGRRFGINRPAVYPRNW